MVKEELIIINHIGTSVENVITDEINRLVNDIKLSTNSDILIAFSSKRAITKLAEKHVRIWYIYDLISSGITHYKRVTVLPIHLVGGEDGRKVKDYCEQIMEGQKLSGTHTSVHYLPALLSDEKKVDQLVTGISQVIKETSTPILFVGHGTTHESQTLYDHFVEAYKKVETNSFFVTLNDDLNKVIAILPRELVLFPLFTINGHHVQKDIFEGDDSIYNQLSGAGIKVIKYEKGLLSYESIRKLYVKSLNESGG